MKTFLLVSFLPFHSLFFLNLKPPVHFSLLRYLLKMKIDIFIYISLYKNLHISSQNILNVYIIRFYNTHSGKLKCKKKQNRSIFKYVTAKHFLSLYLQQALKEQWLSQTAKLLQSSKINLCGQNYLLTRILLLLFLFQFCRKTKL